MMHISRRSPAHGRTGVWAGPRISYAAGMHLFFRWLAWVLVLVVPHQTPHR
jgi:hypothetical protein